MLSGLKYCIYEKKGRIAYITINNPERLNAVSLACNQEMYDVFTDFNEDPEVWTAIITGAGDRAFCVGSDVKEMAERATTGAPNPLDSLKSAGYRERFQEGGIAHREIWKPIIAAVRGYCVGGGLEIAMACDIIIATEDARFGMPEIRTVGGFPGDGGILRLPRLIPLKIAMDMLLTGRYITAQEAMQYGLINKIVPKDQLMATATAKAAEINENPPLAVRISKEMIMRSLDRPLDTPTNIQRMPGTSLMSWARSCGTQRTTNPERDLGPLPRSASLCGRDGSRRRGQFAYSHAAKMRKGVARGCLWS